VIEVEFHHGREVTRLTRQQIIDAVQDQTPRPINTWAVEIEGRRFPVVQPLLCAVGVARRDFRIDHAVDTLDRLGFSVFRIRQPASPVSRLGEHSDLTRGATTRERHPPDHRLAALTAAVQLVAGRSYGGVAEVLETAEAFEAWLTR
jgi:hypothetical protein